MKKNILFTFTILFSSIALIGCSTTQKEKELNDVLIEKTEIDASSISTSENDPNAGVKIDVSQNPDLQGEGDPKSISLMEDAENSNVSFSEDSVNIVALTDLHTLSPSDSSLIQTLSANLTDYFKHYKPDLDDTYFAYPLPETETETNTYYTIDVRVEGINSDGSDMIVKAIWVFGTPTGKFNFFSDLSPEGTDILVDKDGNPIDWDSPINNPFAEEE